MKPDPRLTWSLCFRSGSWGGSAPPCQCGDRWAGSLFGCSGSAVPLPGSSGSFLFGDSGQWLQTCNVFFRTLAQNASRLVWSDIWNSKTYHCWWPGKPGAPRERWGRFCCTCLSSLQLKKTKKKRLKVFFWKLSGEARNTVEVSLCFLRLLLFLSWFSDLLLFESGAEQASFYTRPRNESLPWLQWVAQDGTVNRQEGIYTGS